MNRVNNCYPRSSVVAKAQVKAYNTCIAPQAAYHSCSGAVHVTNNGLTAL